LTKGKENKVAENKETPKGNRQIRTKKNKMMKNKGKKRGKK
jgi:hypothetical protein